MTGGPVILDLAAPAGSGLALARALRTRRGPARPAAEPGFRGTERTLRGHGLVATLREPLRRQPCRLLLSGGAEAIGDALPRLAEAGATPLPVPVPTELHPDQPIGAAFGALIGAYGAAIAAETAGVLARREIEPVHRMRVAVRRLRSALALFRPAASGPVLDEAAAELRALMRLLGPARDWDVFLAGTAARLAIAFPEEPAIRALLAAARRARGAAYGALGAHLRGTGFRLLLLRLAWLAAARPWQEPDPPPPLSGHAARMLGRRWSRMRTAGAQLGGLDDAALHALRLQAKRMRYACEFLAPLFPGRASRRWVKRLARLQDRLGTFNDAAVAAGLLARLGPAGEGFAAGAVRGLLVAEGDAVRERIARAWARLERLEPFWE